MLDRRSPRSSNGSALSFTQGFIVGQITVVILIAVIINYFIFGDATPASDATAARRRLRSFSSPGRVSFSTNTSPADTAAEAKKASSALRISPPLTIASILSKTYYNVSGHQPESVDWFNVLIAQTIAQLRADAQQDGAILSTLNTILNGERKPDFLDDIRVTEVNLGNEFPIFSNCRVIPVESGDGRGGSRLQACMDVDLSDALTLGIETRLILNYPKPLVAVMPVALAVSVVRFSGTLSISFIPSPADTPSVPPSTSDDTPPPQPHGSGATPPTTLAFSFLPDYRLSLSTHSQLGSRARLQNVPKIAQLVEARLHDWFNERCVEPRFQQVVLPSLWPRKRNTRGGDVGAEAGGDDDIAVPGVSGVGIGAGYRTPAMGTPGGRKEGAQAGAGQKDRSRDDVGTPTPTPTSRSAAKAGGLRERRMASGSNDARANADGDSDKENRRYSMPGGLTDSVLA